MITPRSTRLVRVSDLRTAHRAIAARVIVADPLAARACAVIVPTRGAAHALRRTLERLFVERGERSAVVLPELVTRADLYARFHEQLPGAPPLLSPYDREVLFRRAARISAERHVPPPFRLRPGLVAEILRFYDELRRRSRTVSDFERLMEDSLSLSASFDRGAERLLRLTRFLSAAFAEFERSLASSGCVDEHGLRALLLNTSGATLFERLVVTVADQVADPLGLWPVDYDLFARIAGLEAIDIIATENLLATGYLARVHDLLPGIEEEHFRGPAATPVLVAPETKPSVAPVLWFTSRDREEELADAARAFKASGSLERVAVVFQRPLPYLYLARYVFADAELPYQAVDALPLAAEPFAAALDVVLTVFTSEATRSSLVEMLGSPHWRFTDARNGREITPADVGGLDDLLRDRKYFGGWERFSALAAEAPAEVGADHRSARRIPRASAALAAAVTAACRLREVGGAPSASEQIEGLLAFVRDHERLPLATDPWYARHLRARAAILATLQSLAAAYGGHDNGPIPPGELASTLRRWIEGQTFSPQTGASGVTLLDAAAAPFADMDEVRLIGLVDDDWPDRGRRNIFYPASLLTQVGWPAEGERQSAARARFQDLLRLPHHAVSVSTFTLEDDAIVAPSILLEGLETSGMATERRQEWKPVRIFTHQALSEHPLVPEAVRGNAAEWLALRSSRTAADGAQFHGAAGRRDPGVYAVSQIEKYLDCPFKYFAAYVLRLEEERGDESGLSAQERGQLLHQVFEQFFTEWHAAGHHAVTAENLSAAVVLFHEVAEQALARLSAADRELERTYLLGSAASAGLAERAFAFEIEHGVGVVERLLEERLEGEFVFTAGGRPRRLALRGKADRIDVLEDGTLRVIDYKLGRAPKPSRALQLPVYGVCAVQQLEGRHGRTWTVSRAGYVAFREKNAFVPLGGASLQQALDDGQVRFLRAVDAIEAGDFPPRPDEPFICTRCGYAPVCRKDYVGDE